MKECIPSRRDQTKVAWHEVPGNRIKVEPVPKGRLICSLVPEIPPRQGQRRSRTSGFKIGTRSLVLKTPWTFRHEKVLPMAVIALESPEE